ncbi:Alpha/Beta hydrolase protein [Cladorrhinum sp. PSN259]|nr:Alpha/Beta hydrolase protein [Cladorrhinum sp. PSN259]
MKTLSALNALIVASLPHLVASVDPHVNLTYTQYIGQPAALDVTEWLGMRYAVPPIRRLRFSKPQDPATAWQVPELATKYGARCIPTRDYNFDETDEKTWSEDCLFLNVFAPTNATTESKLPVFVYIPGGFFEINEPFTVNGAGLVAASNHSIIVVTFNYRVGPFGFLTGVDELRFEQPSGLTANNGFRDQIKALEWVQRHITEFGGNPDQVVLGGSGSSLSWHLTANDGDNRGLFHAVAGASPSWTSMIPHYRDLQNQYQDFLRGMDCEFKGQPYGEPESICIRLRKTWQEIRRYSYLPRPGHSTGDTGTLWGPVIDDDLFKRTPFEAFEEGKFARVPAMFGDTTHSGRMLVPTVPFMDTIEKVDTFWKSRFPFLNTDDLKTLHQWYPSPHPNQNQTECGPGGCLGEQVSRAFGEMANLCPAIFINTHLQARGVKQSFNYRYDVADPTYSNIGLGVPYGMENWGLFGPSNVPPMIFNSPTPQSYMPDEPNSLSVQAMQAYWTSFIRTFDPNTSRAPGSVEWIPYSDSHMRLLLGGGGQTSSEWISPSMLQKCSFFLEKIYRFLGNTTTSG